MFQNIVGDGLDLIRAVTVEGGLGRTVDQAGQQDLLQKEAGGSLCVLGGLVQHLGQPSQQLRQLLDDITVELQTAAVHQTVEILLTDQPDKVLLFFGIEVGHIPRKLFLAGGGSTVQPVGRRDDHVARGHIIKDRFYKEAALSGGEKIQLAAGVGQLFGLKVSGVG